MNKMWQTLIITRNAAAKVDLPTPKTFQLHCRSFTIEKHLSNKMSDPNKEVSYEDMLKLINEPKKTIIDVRSHDEVNSTGMIPSSINIPLENVKNTLSMSENEFWKQYHHNKPSANDEIVFYCRSGKRASQAMNQAIEMGYKKSKTYPGSWMEWSDKQE